MMFTWLFEDKTSGEEFFVEAETREKAKEIAKGYFSKPKCYGAVPEEYAEAAGYDTY